MAEEEEERIVVGDHVLIPADNRTGIVKFTGPVHFQPGTVFGIELDDPHIGSCDGSVNGWRYFDSEDSKAVFVKRADLQKLGADFVPDPSSVTPMGAPDEGYRSTGNTGGPSHNPHSDRWGAPPPSYGGKRKHLDEPNTRGRGLTEEQWTNLNIDELEDEDDSIGRIIRGRAAALDDDLLDYKSGPNDTEVEVNYALIDLPHNEIVNMPQSRFKKAIANTLPQKIDPSQLDLTFEKLPEYTEMKVKTEVGSPEEADDLKWSMLDPVHVRKLNDATLDEGVRCDYTYLKRHNQEGCCKWVKPCLCCFCCWALILSLLLGWLFLGLNKLAKDIADYEADQGSGGSGGSGLNCRFSSGLSICDQIQKNADDLAALGERAGANEADIADLKQQYEDQMNCYGFVDLQVEEEEIKADGTATARCPSEDHELIGCWVDIPNHWWMFQTYVTMTPIGWPDCACNCKHKDDSFGCAKVGAKCMAQCATFGQKPDCNS